MKVEELLEWKTNLSDPLLKERIENLLSENRAKNLLESNKTVTYHGKTLPIKNVKVKLSLSKIKDNMTNIK